MLNSRTNRRPMTRLARFASLGVLVVASVVVAGLRAGPVTAAQETMYRVDYVKTRTRGATVLELEEGTHTFAPTGHRRVDRVVDGERTTTEIVVPEPAGSGRQIVIDYSQGSCARARSTSRRELGARCPPCRCCPSVGEWCP